MKEPFETSGIWWLPDDDNNQLSGKLTFSQEQGIHLELIGVFESSHSKHHEEPPIILGVSQSGQKFTLHRCIVLELSLPMTGLGKAKYFAHMAFEGVHFEDESLIKFNQLRGAYSDLDAWIGIHGFSGEDDIGEGKFNITIRYEEPDSIFYDIGNNIEAGLAFNVTITTPVYQSERIISQQANLVIRTSGGDLPFDELFSYLNRFAYLHQMAIQRMNYPLEISGYSSRNEENPSGDNPFQPKIKIYYPPVEALVSRKEKIPQEMLFTFRDLNESHIINWFKSFEEHQTVIHLYRSLFYSNRLFIETRFLNITQAIEILHSALFENQYLKKTEFNARKSLVLSSVPHELKDWVSEALQNANYKRLRLKVLEVLEKMEYLFKDCILENDLFAKRVVATRNKFVHHSEQKDAFVNGEELITAITLLTFLVEAYVLELIGFPTEKLVKIFEPRMQRHLSRFKPL